MKTKYLSLLLGLSLLTFSCTKDEDNENTKTVEQYLVAHTWLMENLTYLQNNSITTYKRSNSNNSAFLNDRITFKSGGIGEYINTYNETFDFTWQFSDNDKARIAVVIFDISNGRANPGTDLSLVLENLSVNSNQLRYTEIYTTNGTATMSAVLRQPL